MRYHAREFYVICLKKKTWTQAIFCTNFSLTWGNYPPCRQVWCESCYTSNLKLKFQVHSILSEHQENGEDKMRSKDHGRKDTDINTILL